MTSATDIAIPGWYGKLPGLGDFASRRLPGEFVRLWDAWLQDVMHATRASLGAAAWLDCYLTTPIWRFVVLPHVVGPSAYAGVLMPSVDRVGRQFPLTLAIATPSYAVAAHAVFDGAAWYGALETAALSALDASRGADDLDQSLSDVVFLGPADGALVECDAPLRPLLSVETFGTSARSQALRAWSAQARWTTLWWTRGRIDAEPLMLTSAALPTAEEFRWLLESRMPTRV